MYTIRKRRNYGKIAVADNKILGMFGLKSRPIEI